MSPSKAYVMMRRSVIGLAKMSLLVWIRLRADMSKPHCDVIGDVILRFGRHYLT